MKIFQLSKPLALLLFVGGIFLMPACSDVNVEVVSPYVDAHKFDNQVFLEWNNTFMEIERYAPGYRPGPAPRALAYLGLSAYESIVSSIPENNSLATVYPALQIPKAEKNVEYYWPAVVNASYAFLMERFFYHMENVRPAEFALIAQLNNKLHNQYAGLTPPEVLERSEEYGRAVAAAVYQWEASDAAGHNAFLNPRPVEYIPPTGPGKWKPTYPDLGRAVFPYWGNVRRFAMKDEDILARPPIPYSENENSLYYTQGLEVFNTVKNINEDGPGAYQSRWIAEFWSDDMTDVTFSPPTRMIAILNQVVDKEQLDLAACAEIYAKMGMSINDAGVAVWNSKYYYNIERPVTFIRDVIAQKQPEAANWLTILNNP